MSGSKDLFEEKPSEIGEQSQYGDVILVGELKRLKKENTSKETMSPRAVRKSFFFEVSPGIRTTSAGHESHL